MSRHFSLPTVLRMVPNTLLKKFFARLDYPCYSLDWKHLGERQIEPLLNVFEMWPADWRESIEAILRHVFDLACPAGVAAILSAVRQVGSEALLQKCSDSANPYVLAMWTWLNAPEVFDLALMFHQAEGLSWWRKRDDLPSAEPRTDTDALFGLARDISDLLTREQGRGRQCTVEHLRRDNGTDYFFCYPDDFVRTVVLHDEDGQLTTRTVRQTFEIIFAYQQEEGTLQLFAQVPTRLKSTLEDSFAWNILSERLGERQPREVYHLDRLKDPRFRLDTDPDDGLLVRVRRLRIDFPDKSRRIVLESKQGESDDVLQMFEECLNTERVQRDEVSVSLATFQFHFRPTTGRGRGTMTFDVACPNTCSLRAQHPERVELARKYLCRWRIAHVRKDRAG